MHEDTIIYLLYFAFATLGIFLAGRPFFQKRKPAVLWKTLYGLILIGHAFFLSLLLLVSLTDTSGDPQGGMLTALGWLYGLMGHAVLMVASGLLRVAGMFFKNPTFGT